MENLPKWFWIALGAVVIITLGALIYCNNKNKTAITVNDNTDEGPLTVIDQIPSLSNAIK